MFSSACSSFFLSLNRSFFTSAILARESWDSAGILHIKALLHSYGKESEWYSLEKHCRTKWNFENDNFRNCARLYGTHAAVEMLLYDTVFKPQEVFLKGKKGNPYCTYIPTLRAQPSLPLRLCAGMSRTAPSANVAWNWRCRGTSEGLVFIAFVLFCCFFCFFSPP